MKRHAHALCLLLAALAGLPAALQANGFRLLSQDAFATARGEAFAATADNPSAIYYNPAGIAQLDGTQVRAGIYGIHFDTSFCPPANAPNHEETYHAEENLAAVPQFFLTHTPERLPVTLGLGIYAPFGGGLTWPQDTGFRAVALEGSLSYATINPVLAWQVAPGFALAAGATVNYGKIELEQGLLRNERPFANYFRFEGEGWSAGYTLGVLWQPHDKLALGASFRSVATTTMDGQTEFQQQPVIPATTRGAYADFTFPLNAVVGISYRPVPRWNFEFNADYTDWSSLGTITIYQTTPPPFPVQQNIPFTLNWKPSWIYKIGATRYFENGWHVSAGYVFNENSVPDDFYSPLAADLDRHFLSVGVGRKGRRFDFDLAYQFGYGPARKVTGSAPSSQPALFAGQTADGTYEFISHAVLLTVGLRF